MGVAHKFAWAPRLGMVALLIAAMVMMFGQTTALAQSADKSGSAGADLEDLQGQLPDIDTRLEGVKPAATTSTDALGANVNVRFNKFGTPASIIRYDGDIATGLTGDAVTATRAWLSSNAALFKLTPTSVANLQLVADNILPDTTAHIVLYRQLIGGLPAAQDGMITVLFVKGAITYVSSSSAGDSTLSGNVVLTPANAWLAAATNVGRTVLPSAITNLVTSPGWTSFKVAGFSQPQQVRLRALPLPGGTARRVFEVNVITSQGADVLGYTSYVDAQTGQILFRQNRVQTFDQGGNYFNLSMQAGAPSSFSGSFTPPSTCGPTHGPYAVGAGISSLIVAATATLPTNDIVLKLLRNTTVVGTSDTATSPEGILYSPVGGVPVGNYYVQVCPYSDPTVPAIAPYTYQGALIQSQVNTSVAIAYSKYKFFNSNPQLDYANNDNRATGCWRLLNPSVLPGECARILNNAASRTPWDLEAHSGLSTMTTIGNNATTARSWGSPLTPSEMYRPVSATRDYRFAWTNAWKTSQCSPTAFAAPAMIDSDAAVTNLFVLHNRMHDWSYSLGFSELTWNAQTYNFGFNEDGQNDAQIGNTMAGAVSGGYPSFLGRDNANQIAMQDGIVPISNMYLWQPIAAAFYAPCVDGDYDMSVVGHEYTHLISNRMVGGPDSNLTGHQAGSMGESWSDLAALEFLQGQNYQSLTTAAGFTVGAYVTSNKVTGIRNYNNSNIGTNTLTTTLPSPLNFNPLNYSDIGYDTGGPEVHSDAEIWDAVNHEIRRSLIAKYRGSYPETDTVQQGKCAGGGEPAYHCPGNRRWIAIMFGAFLLMPADVDMLGARDAYLATDRAYVTGFGNHPTCGGVCWPSNQVELWNAFAIRGMGQYASSASSDDTDPKPNFESPLVYNEAEIRFTTTSADEAGLLARAKIYVGDYEARSVPIADTDPTTSMSHIAKFVPGTYRFVIQAPGYGLYRFVKTITGNESVTVALPANWASSAKGAVVSNGGGAGTDATLAGLIDDTENTAWSRTDATGGVNGAAAIVKLSASRTVSRIQVSAALSPDMNRFQALRQFEVWACTASAANSNCASAASFNKIYTSAADAFPGVAPRPTQPNLIIRSFTVPSTTATHFMLKVVKNQCTGNAQFLGEQDADPLNATDCISGSTADENVRVAEFEVFSR